MFHPLFFVLGAVVFLPLWFMFVSFVVSRANGWHKLHKAYACAAEPDGERMMFTSIKLGWGGLKNAVHVTLCEEGVYLRTFFLFAFAHKPVLIPWKAFIRAKGPISFRLLTSGYAFTIDRGDEQIEVKFLEKVGKAIIKAGNLDVESTK